MRTLLLERNEEVKYSIPFSRSYNAMVNGFSPSEIEEIRTILSGKGDETEYATRITFDRTDLLDLLDRGSNNLGPAIDSIEIATDVEQDPVLKDLADIISLKINNQVSLLKKVRSEQDGDSDKVRSQPSEPVKLSASEKLVDMIKKFESFKDTPYVCPGGALTIGYGQTIKPGEYTSITKEQADAMLRRSIARFEASIKKLVKVPLNQNQYDALVSFVYNVGVEALKKSTLLQKLNSANYDGAAAEFSRWSKSDGKVLGGLVKRREMERNLFLS